MEIQTNYFTSFSFQRRTCRNNVERLLRMRGPRVMFGQKRLGNVFKIQGCQSLTVLVKFCFGFLVNATDRNVKGILEVIFFDIILYKHTSVIWNVIDLKTKWLFLFFKLSQTSIRILLQAQFSFNFTMKAFMSHEIVKFLENLPEMNDGKKSTEEPPTARESFLQDLKCGDSPKQF